MRWSIIGLIKNKICKLVLTFYPNANLRRTWYSKDFSDSWRNASAEIGFSSLRHWTSWAKSWLSVAVVGIHPRFIWEIDKRMTGKFKFASTCKAYRQSQSRDTSTSIDQFRLRLVQSFPSLLLMLVSFFWLESQSMRPKTLTFNKTDI